MAKIDRDVAALAEAFNRLKQRKLSVVKKGNPHKAGSAARARWTWLLRSARQNGRVGDYLTSKGHPVTLRNAIARGYVELS